MPIAEVRAVARVDLSDPSSRGDSIRLAGMGATPDVRQIKTPRGWTIEVNTAAVWLL